MRCASHKGKSTLLSMGVGHVGLVKQEPQVLQKGKE